MKSGVIIINKEEGVSSHTVVAKTKRILGASKAGHTGTLDPLATGVLPVLLERGVKASEFMLTSDKYYLATLTLGVTTDTEDVTGNILTRSDSLPSEEEVLSAVSEFVGKYKQTPPMYSALKVGGKKLCDLAREGVVIEREAREVEIFSAECKKLTECDYSLDVHCSKGTYIRTLCADIGKKLGCGGIMKTLTRKCASGFTLSDSVTLSELEAMSPEERECRIYPVEYVFRDKEEIVLPEFFARLAAAGQEIYLHKIGKDLPLGEIVRLSDKRGFFAVGEVREYEGGTAIKPIRQFG